MARISMVMFDLSGTTIYEDKEQGSPLYCLYKAAQEFNLNTTPEELLYNMGTNKIHLYQFLIARSKGSKLDIRDFEKSKDPRTLDEATTIYRRYNALMVESYKKAVREIPGTSDTFRWCHDNGIKVATNTGFHRNVVEVIMGKLRWIEDGLVDLSVDVEDIPGEIGRPAPFMIYYAMNKLNVQAIQEVIKIGDTPADMLEGTNAGCRGVVGVLTGPRPVDVWTKYAHTHLIPSVAELPELIEAEFWT